MAKRIAARTSFNTITSMSIWRAIAAPGQDVDDYCHKIATEVAREAKSHAPINNPANAEHRGGVVGTYHRSFVVITGPRNTLNDVTYLAGNRSDHADIVEKGKPYVRKRQVFTWEHAVISKRFGTRGPGGRFVTAGTAGKGAFANTRNPGGWVSTGVVHAWGYHSKFNPRPAPRRGHRTLENAATTIARARGLRRDIKLTIG